MNRLVDATTILRHLPDNDSEKLGFSKVSIVQVNLDDVLCILLTFPHPKGRASASQPIEMGGSGCAGRW